MLTNVSSYFKDYFNVGKQSWAVRRRIVVITLIFCASTVIYAATPYVIVEKATLLINNMVQLATFVIGYYVFGPVLDDHLQSKWKENVPSDKKIEEIATVTTTETKTIQATPTDPAQPAKPGE